jgi:hypothetical protein
MSLKHLYGSTRQFRGQTFSLEGTAATRPLAEQVGLSLGSNVRYRITRVDSRGVTDSEGKIRRDCWAIWALYL